MAHSGHLTSLGLLGRHCRAKSVRRARAARPAPLAPPAPAVRPAHPAPAVKREQRDPLGRSVRKGKRARKVFLGHRELPANVVQRASPELRASKVRSVRRASPERPPLTCGRR